MSRSASMQDETQSPLVPLMLVGGFGTVAVLHLIAGWRERKIDNGLCRDDDWIVVGPPRSIPDKAARIVAAPGGERIAVFRDGDQIGALTNLCAHQNGPLGEGRIVDGCMICPWHGYQYRLADGCAPAPFTEKLVTYRVRINRGIVEVDPRPLAGYSCRDHVSARRYVVTGSRSASDGSASGAKWSSRCPARVAFAVR